MDDEKPDLTAVLEHYGVLTKDRVSYMTRCPLHEDRTPSLSVNTDKQVWNCHSCGEKGDSYTLIMKKEETSFVGARAIAASLGIAAGESGGGGDLLRGGGYTGSRRVSKGKGSDKGRGGYVPAWRRS